MVRPTPSYEHGHPEGWSHLLASLSEYPKGHCSLPLLSGTQHVSRMSIYHHIRSIGSGWAQRASRFHSHQEQAPVIFSTFNTWLVGKSYSTWCVQQLQHWRAQNKQGIRDSQNCAGEKGSLKVSSPTPCSRHGQIDHY